MGLLHNLNSAPKLFRNPCHPLKGGRNSFLAFFLTSSLYSSFFSFLSSSLTPVNDEVAFESEGHVCSLRRGKPVGI